MSNVPTVNIGYAFNGDPTAANRVNASELDTQFAVLANAQNLTKAALDHVLDSTNSLGADTVGMTQLAPEVLGYLAGLVYLTQVKVVAGAPITLSGAQTIDGVAVVAGDRVLVNGQTLPAQNGIYVASSGAWGRSSDAQGLLPQGTSVEAAMGTAYGGIRFALAAAVTMGVSPNVWQPIDGVSIVAVVDAAVAAAVPTAIAAAMPTAISTTPITATGSTTPRTLPVRFADTVNVLDFGADPTGAADSTAAVTAALAITTNAVFIPAGTYKLLSQITLPTSPVRIFGAGRGVTVLSIPSSFSGSTGVFSCTSSTAYSNGPEISDLTIAFVQPTIGTRASLIHYPPAVYFSNVTRAAIRRVRISNAWVGIVLDNNSGGNTIEDVELSSFSLGVSFPATSTTIADSVKISRLHFWNIDVNASNIAVFTDGVGVAINCVYCDDLHLDNCLIYGQRTNLVAGFGEITGCDFDTAPVIHISGGFWSFAGCSLTSGDFTWMSATPGDISTGAGCIYHTGGEVTVSSCYLQGNIVNNTLVTSTPGSVAAASLAMDDCTFHWAGGTLYPALNFNNANVIVSNSRFRLEPFWVALPGLVPAITVTGTSRFVVSDNNFIDRGSNSQIWLKVTGSGSDLASIESNVAPGWFLDIDDTSAPFQVSADNNVMGPGTGLSLSSNLFVGPRHCRIFEGTLDGSGNATITHNVSNLHKCLQIASAWYKNSTGGAAALAVPVVDGTSIYVAAGAPGAGALYRVTIIFGNHVTSGW